MSFSLRKHKRRYKGRKWIDTRLSSLCRKRIYTARMMASGITAKSLAQIEAIISSRDINKVIKAIAISRVVIANHAAINKARMSIML